MLYAKPLCSEEAEECSLANSHMTVVVNYLRVDFAVVTSRITAAV